MKYKQAFEHKSTCNASSGVDRINKMLEQMTLNDESKAQETDTDEYNPIKSEERCVKCGCIPMKPIYHCGCACGLYCFFCRADGERCREKQGCGEEIKSICFADEDVFETKVFPHQIRSYSCQF